jgi:hypothetical protein
MIWMLLLLLLARSMFRNIGVCGIHSAIKGASIQGVQAPAARHG